MDKIDCLPGQPRGAFLSQPHETMKFSMALDLMHQELGGALAQITPDMAETLGELKPGQEVDVEVIRDGKSVKTKAVMQKRQ